MLTDAERSEVGALYARDSFAARRLGAALVSSNIATHLQGWCAEQPRHWRPLLYCWRGGQRSRSFALVLREIGWKATVIEGGWRAYRRHAREELETLCPNRRFHVLAGLTGVGKTRLLRWLAAHGENVIDLESLANHRGSLFGHKPDTLQPSQKFFESLLWDALHRTEPDRPVWVEAESRRVGRLLLPTPLWAAMMAGTVTEVTAPLEARVDALLDEYSHFRHTPEAVLTLLPTLVGRHSRAQVARWETSVRGGKWREFVRALLTEHYDPAYRNAVGFPAPTLRVSLASVDEAGIAAAWAAAVTV